MSLQHVPADTCCVVVTVARVSMHCTSGQDNKRAAHNSAGAPAQHKHRRSECNHLCDCCRYKLTDKIPIKLGLADGRFTTIWHAKDTTTNKDVVLKVRPANGCCCAHWMATGGTRTELPARQLHMFAWVLARCQVCCRGSSRPAAERSLHCFQYTRSKPHLRQLLLLVLAAAASPSACDISALDLTATVLSAAHPQTRSLAFTHTTVLGSWRCVELQCRHA